MAIPKGGNFNDPPPKHHHPAHHPSQHPGGYIPGGDNSHPTNSPGFGGSGGSPGGGGSTVHTPPAWIVRRQQALRRAGYNVAVDGVWGTQSQHAWEVFNQRIALTAHITAAQHQVERQMHSAQALLTQKIRQAQIAPRPAITVPQVLAHRGGIDPRIAQREQRQGRRQFDQQITKQLTAIAGGDLKNINDPRFLQRQAVAGHIGGDDLRLLLDHKYVNPMRSADDVKVIQQVINSHLPGAKLDVNGKFDSATANGIIKLAARNAAFHYRAQLANTQRTLYNTGIAQDVTRAIYGHVIAPAALLGLLQAGGRQARQVTNALDRAYLAYEQDLRLKDQLHQVAVAFGQPTTGPLARFQSEASDRFLIAGLGGSLAPLAGSKTLPDFVRIGRAIIAKEDARRLAELGKRAKHETGWWAETKSGLGDVSNALGWSGQKGAEVGLSTLDFFYGGLNVLIPGTAADLEVMGNAGPGKHGFVTPWKAWDNGTRTLTEMDPVMRVLWESVLDPLNLVGTGLLADGARGSALFSARVIERLTQGVDSVGHLMSPELYVALQRARFGTVEGLDALGRAHPNAALRAFAGETFPARWARGTRAYRIATQTRAIARNAANTALREAYVTGLRPIVQSRIAEATLGVVRAGTVASDRLIGVLSPEDLDAVKGAVSEFGDALAANVPDLVTGLSRVPTSIYSDFGRTGGNLSVFGAELEGQLLEQASRTTLERYAIIEDLGRLGIAPAAWEAPLDGLSLEDLRTIHSAHASPGRLNTLQGNLGNYRYGHPPLRFRDAYHNELSVTAERIQKQLLPALDDLLRHLHGDTIWDGALGALRDEAGVEMRAAMNEFFGYDVKAAFDPANYVRVKNPNYGDVVSERDAKLLIDDEISRRSNAVVAWAERQKRLAAADAATIDHWATQEIAKIRADVTKAWKRARDGRGFFDARKTVKVPLPQARGIKNLNASDASAQLDRLGQAMADGGRARNYGDGIYLHAAEEELIRQALPGDATWQKFATSADRLESLHGMVQQQMLAKAMFDQGLVLSGLRASQALRHRTAYYTLTAGLWTWKTLALPLRPGFFFRNVVDNFTKSLLEGLRDPRLFFNAEGRSIFEVGLVREMLGLTTFFDRMFGTDVRTALEHILSGFWSMHPETVEKIFAVHGIPVAREVLDVIREVSSHLSADGLVGSHGIAIPENVTDQLRTSRGTFEDVTHAPSVGAGSGGGRVTGALADLQPNVLPQGLHDAAELTGATKLAGWMTRFSDHAWELMAAKPEVAQRKMLYVSTYRHELAAGKTEAQAMEAAWETVDRTLFDYDTVTVLEENLKVFMPFIFFWRKNAQFWAGQLVDKPWFFADADRLNQLHQDGNADMPEWMRRYVSLAPVASLTDQVPGLHWMSDWLRNGANFDPLNYTSIIQFYRAFKEGNQMLAPDRQGWAFISGIVDGFNADAGLGINPFWSEAGQRLGILNRHSWRDIFPQTTVIQGLTDISWVRKQLGIDSPNGFNVEDWLLDPLFKHLTSEPTGAELSRNNFDYYVNIEMAEQANRGEPVNRSAAEAKVRGYTVFQTLVGYAIGIFPRRISTDSRAIYAAIDQRAQIYGDPSLTPAERDAKLTAEWYSLTPDEQTAYRLFKNRGWDPAAFDRYANGIQGAQAFFEIDDPRAQQQFLQDHPNVKAIVEPGITHSLTSEQYLQDQLLLSRTDAIMKFASAYLTQIDADASVRQEAWDSLITPSLRQFWAANDTSQEIQDKHTRGAFFRYVTKVQDTYFSIPSTDFSARSQYLAQHPVLTDWWRINDGASDDYKAILQSANGTFREVYFHFVDKGDWHSADAFLRLHPFIFDFTSAEGRVDPQGKWHPKSEAQAAYAKVVEKLRVYYTLTGKARAAYAISNPAIGYFLKKYGSIGTEMVPGQSSYSPGGLSQHAIDYLKVKSQLDAYFALPDAERAAYLAAHPELKAYFAKYAKDHGTTRGFTSGSDSAFIHQALAENPTIAARYRFWTAFFKLKPDQRPAFIHHHAEDAGIFIYGSLGYDKEQQQIERWHRESLRFGGTERAFWYRRIAPLMNIYFTLKPGGGDRAIFLQTNPELAYYFEHFSKALDKIPKDIRPLVEEYHRLPEFSSQRALYLQAHPKLIGWINRDATPKELALRRQVDAYFQLPFGRWRDEYVATHPEVAAYFDQRAAEHATFSSLAAAFNETDPRMQAFYDQYHDIIPLDAIKQWQLAAKRTHEIIDKGARRERAPETPSKSQTRRDRVVS